MRRNQDGFTLIELMFVVVILATIVMFMTGSFTTFIREQTASIRDATETSTGRASLTILQQDVLYAGFGETINTVAITGTNNGGVNGSDTLTLRGLPLGGPHMSQWTFTIDDTSALSSDTLFVKCHGIEIAGQRFPAPQTDITGASAAAPIPVRVTNFAGQQIFNQPLKVVATSPTCTPGPDLDSDGVPDWQMSLTFDKSVGFPQASIIVASRTYQGATASEATYSIDADNRLVRTTPGLAAQPLLFNVEDFQVQYAWSGTDGTFQGWSDTPIWAQNMRTTAVKVNITMADPTRTEHFDWNQITNFDHTYNVAAGSKRWARTQLERIFEAPNARFSHP